MKKTPTVLLIMDGYGLNPSAEGNAIAAAKTPNLDRLFARCPNTRLAASGEDVGLPEGQMGNSEVGHTNIGAGRVVLQELPRISLAAKTGKFAENPAYRDAMLAVRGEGALHLMGLLSDGGVHSHITHLFALLDAAKALGVKRVYIHAFLDGRDVPPKSGAGYLRELQKYCAEHGCGEIATVMGRFYAMDRDKRWERLQRALDAIVSGEGEHNPDPVAAIEAGYEKGITDEFAEPVVCLGEGARLRDGDSVIFFNFRPDRARELTWALTGNLPKGANLSFERPNVRFVCTARYDEALTDLPVAFPPESIGNTLGNCLSALGLTQLRIAETEKYAHVTFFFNGGVETPDKGEKRILIDSPREYPTYDLIPEMSARKVTDGCVAAIKSGDYDVIICNLANCDMVGHTGVMPAAIKAVETVDECVGRIVDAASDCAGVCLITADHGNADSMLLPDGTPNTAHTTNPVPLIITGADVALAEGRLADIAPTMLELMGCRQPEEMTGKSLIISRR